MTLLVLSYCYVVQLEMHVPVRLICAIKFYTYLLTYLFSRKQVNVKIF